MAVGVITDFTIYEEEFHTLVTEILQQNTAFNAESGNTINIVPAIHQGDYRKYTLFDQTLVASRRVDTSVTAQTPGNLPDLEAVGVKLKRKIPYTELTLDSLKEKGMNSDDITGIAAQQTAQAILDDYMNTAVSAMLAAFNVGTTIRVQTGATIDSAGLVDGIKLFGDKASRLRTFVMHSAPYYNLVKDQLADNILNVSDMNIMAGVPATLGKRVVVTDAASLVDTTPSPDVYHNLLLAPGACTIFQSQAAEVWGGRVEGKENLTFGYQYEYAFTLEIKGYAWDITNGGRNPDATALTTQTNWDQYASSHKDTAGVLITVNQ